MAGPSVMGNPFVFLSMAQNPWGLIIPYGMGSGYSQAPPTTTTAMASSTMANYMDNWGMHYPMLYPLQLLMQGSVPP